MGFSDKRRLRHFHRTCYCYKSKLCAIFHETHEILVKTKDRESPYSTNSAILKDNKYHIHDL